MEDNTLGIVLKCVISFVFVCVFTFFSSWYKDYYFEKKKKSIKETFILSYKFMIIWFSICMLFLAVSIFLEEKKGHDYLTLLENQIVWCFVFLIAYIDIRVKKIPNKLILILLVIRLLFIFINVFISFEVFWSVFLYSVIGALAGGIIILICALISRGGVGFGDVKMFTVVGLYFGLHGVIAIMMYSLFLAAIYGLFLIIFKKAKMKSTIAMAPFIFLGLSFHLFIS